MSDSKILPGKVEQLTTLRRGEALAEGLSDSIRRAAAYRSEPDPRDQELSRLRARVGELTGALREIVSFPAKTCPQMVAIAKEALAAAKEDGDATDR